MAEKAVANTVRVSRAAALDAIEVRVVSFDDRDMAAGFLEAVFGVEANVQANDCARVAGARHEAERKGEEGECRQGRRELAPF